MGVSTKNELSFEIETQQKNTRFETVRVVFTVGCRMSIANVVPVDQDSIFISTGVKRAKIRDPLALAILTKKHWHPPATPLKDFGKNLSYQPPGLSSICIYGPCRYPKARLSRQVLSDNYWQTVTNVPKSEPVDCFMTANT